MNTRVRTFLTFLILLQATVRGQTLTDIVDLIREGNVQEARTQLARIDRDGLSPESLLFLEGLLTSDADSASRFFRQLIRDYPASRYSDDALLRLAQHDYARGLYRGALQHFSRLLDAYPRSSLHQSCHYWMGLCYLSIEESDSAKRSLQNAIDESPNTDLARIARNDIASLESGTPDDDPADETVTGARYAVQVGAFSNQTRAILQKSYFERKGYRVDLRTKQRQGETLYLVWVGSFTSRDQALHFGEQLKKQHGVSYILVSE